MASTNQSRAMLKLGKEAVGHRLVTDIFSSDGMVVAYKGTILNDAMVEKLLSQGITVVLIEPEATSKARANLDHMFASHLDDPYMNELHKAAISTIDPKDER